MGSDLGDTPKAPSLLEELFRGRLSVDRVNFEHVASSLVLVVAVGIALLSRFSSVLLFVFGVACGALLMIAIQVMTPSWSCHRLMA